MWEYNVTVLRIIDADTLHVRADLGFSVHAEITIRLDRIDAWEITEPRGIVARAYVHNLIASCTAVKITSRRQDKYGRWLAEVYLQAKLYDREWVNLNDDLVLHSHAVYKSYD